MKRHITLLAAGALPLILALGACGDDVVDADDIADDDGGRKDATPLPDGRPSSSSSSSSGSNNTSSGSTSSSSSGGEEDAGDAGEADAGDAGDAGDDLEEGTEAEQMERFAIRLADAYCTNYETCCGTEAPDCRPARTDLRFFGRVLSGYYFKQAVATGERVDYDVERARSCLSKVRAMGCIEAGIPAATWKDIITTCGRVFVGTGDQGDTCYADIECKEQFACNGVGTGEDQPGTCQPLVPQGQPYRNGALSDSCSWNWLALDNGNFAERDAEGALFEGARCMPPQANGVGCLHDQQCTSYACSADDIDNPVLTCQDVKQDPYFCFQF